MPTLPPRFRIVALLALALGAAACAPDAPQQYRVPDLRILAIRDQVDPPATFSLADGDAGQSIVLEALVANPRARPGVTVDWFACLPYVGGPPPPCLDTELLGDPDALAAAGGIIALGTGTSVTVSLSDPRLDVPLVGVSAVLGSLFDGVMDAPDPEQAACLLFVDLPVVAVARAGPVVEVAFKRVRLSPTAATLGTVIEGVYVPNRNPRIDALETDATNTEDCTGGTALPPAGTLPGGKVSVCARPVLLDAVEGSIQRYNQCQADGSRLGVDEELEWQWYASGGEIAGTDFFGNATGSEIELTPPTGPFTLWVILRDGRGGSSWEVRDF